MSNIALIDSGVLIALFDTNDRYHKQARAFIKNNPPKFITSLAVITEVCYLLSFSTEAQLDFLN